MVFNSGVFVVFFCIVLALYWGLAKLPGDHARRYQNRFLLLASYFFYGWWDWVFLSLIGLSTVTDYIVARALESTESDRRRKLWLAVSVAVNLGLLGTFKYFDFFITGFVDMSRVVVPGAFPDGGHSLLLKVLLPVGISFYTFQTMSYTIDVYRREIRAERNFWDFGLFVCFFPQLVAGPIERAGDLLPQFKKKRLLTRDDIAKGAWLILFGFFLKVFVADNLGPIVDQVYLTSASVYKANPALASGHGGFQVFMATLAFIAQIYGDFAGYSSIALGTARLMGIRLTVNFDAPELSQNPSELWHRWHSTLNRWVTDYIYIPLGGSRAGPLLKRRNLLIAFMLMGFWHGANWTFILWGLYHALWIIGYDITAARLPQLPESAPGYVRVFVRGLKMFGVYVGFAMSATVFRSYDLAHAVELWKSMLNFPWNLVDPVNQVPNAARYTMMIVRKVLVLLAIDVAGYYYKNNFWILDRPLWVRVLVYTTLAYCVVIMGDFGRDVIYFAF